MVPMASIVQNLPKLIESWVRQQIDERYVFAGRVTDSRTGAILRHFAEIEPGSRTTVLLDVLRLQKSDLGLGTFFERRVNAPHRRL